MKCRKEEKKKYRKGDELNSRNVKKLKSRKKER
jgi:hypothetical protein